MPLSVQIQSSKYHQSNAVNPLAFSNSRRFLFRILHVIASRRLYMAGQKRRGCSFSSADTFMSKYYRSVIKLPVLRFAVELDVRSSIIRSASRREATPSLAADFGDRSPVPGLLISILLLSRVSH